MCYNIKPDHTVLLVEPFVAWHDNMNDENDVVVGLS